MLSIKEIHPFFFFFSLFFGFLWASVPMTAEGPEREGGRGLEWTSGSRGRTATAGERTRVSSVVVDGRLPRPTDRGVRREI